MNHIARETLTLLIPEEADEKEYVTKYRAVYLKNTRMEAAKASELSELGFNDTSGVEAFFIFKYSKAYDKYGNRLQYRPMHNRKIASGAGRGKINKNIEKDKDYIEEENENENKEEESEIEDTEQIDKTWWLNSRNCLLIRGKIDIEETDTKQTLSQLYKVYTIRNIEELYKNDTIHHIEMVGV